MNWEAFLLQLGIADATVAAQTIVALSSTGPQFKLAAQNAITALAALGQAAQNPKQ